MSQRQFTLTGVLTRFDGSFVVGADCSFQPLIPGGTGAIDGNGTVVQTEAKRFTTNASGAFVQLDGTTAVSVDYPGDYQAPYVNTQVRVIVNGVTTDSPIGFGYAGSIDYSAWLIAPSTAGKVNMRAVYTADDGTGIGGALGSVAIVQPATVVATGVILSAANPVVKSSASDGTMLFPLDPNSLLNPSVLNYGLQITNPDGTQEPTVWYFTVPTVVDVYRGAYNSGTTYSAASGASNGDVVVSAGVLYRFINVTPSAGHAPPNATYWSAIAGLPTDLVTAHLNMGALSGQVSLTAGNIGAVENNFSTPHGSPVSVQDVLDDAITYARHQAIFGASGGSHAAGDVPDPGSSAGTTRALFEDGTWKVPPGSGGGSSAFTWVTKTANYTITTGDSGIAVDATSGDVTITLLSTAGVTQQFAVLRIDTSSHLVTVLTTGGQTITVGSVAVTSLSLVTAGQVYVFGVSGSNWRIGGGVYPSPLVSENDLPYLHNGAIARLTLGTNLSITSGVLNAAGGGGGTGGLIPLANGDLPGPVLLATVDGQCVMVPAS